MTEDERAIRALIDTWMAASKANDLETVLGLMADDAVFMVPGREPFGKEAFAAAFEGMKAVEMTGTADIRELNVLGDGAWCRTYLVVTAVPPGGKAVRRSGYTLTILNKKRDGRWVIARDANLLTTE